jgi:hypothetical protein
VGYAFAMPVVKPFIGVEVAVPLTDYSYETPQSMAAANDGYNKAYAPKLQIGVYGGIRF